MTPLAGWLARMQAGLARFVRDNIVDWQPDIGTDDGPHLDPNGCCCDECRAALQVIRQVVADDAVARADFALWQLECGWADA